MIALKDMQFHAYHGCLESERRDGNLFSVDLEFDYDMEKAALTDNLAWAVDYSEVYESVRRQMAIRSDLIENVAKRILDAIHSEFPAILYAKVTVTKHNPPVGGRCAASSVTIDRQYMIQ